MRKREQNGTNRTWYNSGIVKKPELLEMLGISEQQFHNPQYGIRMYKNSIESLLHGIGFTSIPTQNLVDNMDIRNLKRFLHLGYAEPGLLKQFNISEYKYKNMIKNEMFTYDGLKLITKYLNYYGIYKADEAYVKVTTAGATRFQMMMQSCHLRAANRGFYESPPTFKTHLGLLITEIGEAIEALRRYDKWYFIDDKGKPQGYFSELVDIAIRIYDMLGYFEKENIHQRAYLPPVKENINIDYKTQYGEHPDHFVFDISCLIHTQDYELILYHLQEYIKSYDYNMIVLIDEKLAYNETRGYKHGKKF